MKWANAQQTLLPSLGLEGKAKTHLLKNLDCSILVHSSDDPNSLGFKPGFLSQTVKLPCLRTLLHLAPSRPLPLRHSFEEVENIRLAVSQLSRFQRSKLTRPTCSPHLWLNWIPKTNHCMKSHAFHSEHCLRSKYSHATFALLDARQNVSQYKGHETEVEFRSRGRRHLMAFSPYHGAGLLAGLQDSVWFGLTLFMPPSDRVLDASLVVQIVQQNDIDGVMLSPHIMEKLASNPSSFEVVSRLHYVMFSGGPISEAAGNCISTKTRLINFYGSSEQTYPNILINKNQEDWPYLHFHPQANCFEFRPVVGGQGLFELIVHNDPQCRSHLFKLFPELTEFETKDMFLNHADPHKSSLWKWVGRTDDLVVLDNAWKLNPSKVESILNQVSGVSRSLVLGTRRPRPVALIQPAEKVLFDPFRSQQDFVHRILKGLEIWNDMSSSCEKIPAELVIVASPKKQFILAPKGTVLRNATIKLYGTEIDEAFKRWEKAAGVSG